MNCSPLPARARVGWSVAAIAAAILGCMQPAAAGDEAWTRYENRHFIAYSNGQEKRVRALLEDLEYFRAAFLQFGNITVPPEVPKTAVLIPNTQAEFRKLSPIRLAAGFAVADGRRTLIVMPARGDRDWSSAVIRHEYGHALMSYKKFRYPAWYREGFAELVSATEMVKDGQAFTVGAGTERSKRMELPIYSWETLLSEEFAPHQMTDVRRASSAYAQAWLLAHYATLGGDLKNATRLQNYFDRLKAGEAYGPAFAGAFGMQPADVWETALKPYSKRMPYYTFTFLPGAVDKAFVATAPGAGEVEAYLGYLGFDRAMSGKPQPPADGPGALAGRWAPLRIDLDCTDHIVFAPPADGTVAITPSMPPDRSPLDGGTYRLAAGSDGALRLNLPDDPPDEDAAIHVTYRTPDLMCLGGEPGSCGMVLHRCTP